MKAIQGRGNDNQLKAQAYKTKENFKAEQSSTSRIFVKHLPEAITEEDVNSIFEKYGRVDEVSLKYNANQEVTAIVSFVVQDASDPNEAAKCQAWAILETHGK